MKHGSLVLPATIALSRTYSVLQPPWYGYPWLAAAEVEMSLGVAAGPQYAPVFRRGMRLLRDLHF